MGKISVNNIGKAYKTYPSRKARMLEWLQGGAPARHQKNWVLRNISFEVAAGESVGIIGINGAGKSTLLKLITGTTQPTEGSVALEGNVAALLELGMGFHPDFTGRQNVIMAGQLLGLAVPEIQHMMPAIEEFSEIGHYLDQPVRVYSSGMQMRLAFSVATARRPDILIVDEALSVGDAYFQHKSFQRIREFSDQGTTLLIVSHDKQAIQSVCDRAILLNGGSLEKEGEPEAVMDYYNAIIADKENNRLEQTFREDGRVQTISGTGEVTLESVRLVNAENLSVEAVNVGEPLTLRAEARVNKHVERLVFGYAIKDRLGQVMYGTNTHISKQYVECAKAGEKIVFEAHFSMNLGPGSYSVQTALVGSESHLEHNYEWQDLALVFQVVNVNRDHFAGSAWLPPKIEVWRT